MSDNVSYELQQIQSTLAALTGDVKDTAGSNSTTMTAGAVTTVNPGGAVFLIHGASAGWYIVG